MTRRTAPWAPAFNLAIGGIPMVLRLLPRALLLSCVAHCGTACFINGNGQAQGEARDNGNGNGNGNGSGNGTGNGTGNGINIGPNGASGAGVWDITTSAGAAINPSEMVIVENTATGFIALRSEGKAEPARPSCLRAKDRTEFQLTSTDDKLHGTFTSIREWSGNGCPSELRHVFIVTGERTKPGKSDLDGDWSVTCTEKESFTALLHVSASDGVMTTTSARTELSFAARKR